MTTPPEAGAGVREWLGDLLEPVFADEPPLGDAIAAVFRRAERQRRRRARIVLAAGAAVVVLTTAIGYALATVLPPTGGTGLGARPTRIPATRPDPAQAVLASALRASGLRIVPHEPARGDGWRQYLVRTASGRPYGLVDVSVYAAPAALCFPVLAEPDACARPEHASKDVEYARYAFDRDVNWQVNEVIARRVPDGRALAVQATGERGTGTAGLGRPPLTARLAARVASDPRLLAAFDAAERCNGPERACPVLQVPVPVPD